MNAILSRVAGICAVVAMAAAFPAYADTVTSDDVTSVVVGWQRAREALGEQLTAEPESVLERHGLGGTGTYYVVTLEGGGYVVTSGDTAFEPVLAYSKTGQWVDETAKSPLKAMLEIDIAAAVTGLAERSSAIKSAGARLKAVDLMAELSSANQVKWARYRAAAAQKAGPRLRSSAPSSDLRVSPLLSTEWSQTGTSGTGPNISTPGGENYYTPGNVYCGCVATMAAQMMKYWEWPKGTNITHILNYYDSVIFVNNSYGTAVTNSWNVTDGFPDNIKTKNSSKSPLNPAFGGAYDWANMPDKTQTYSLTDAQKTAIGHLTRDAGISCFMNYSNEGSGASGSVFAHRAVDQFAYTSGQDVGGWNDANRDALLSNLDAGIPCGVAVSKSGSGHAIVADGYGYDSAGTLYIHFNYGWGSSGPQDWYTPPNVGTYNSVNDIIVNVVPPYKSKYDRTIVSGRILSGGSAQNGVTVTATNRETGFSTNVTSNAKGIYSFMLPRGYYTFTAGSGANSAKAEADVKPCFAGTGSNGKSGNIHGLDLTLGTAVSAPAVALTHRWSFTSDYSDSVGSATATTIGSNVNIVDGKAVCTGNGTGQGSLNLGSNLLNTDGATIEIWAANDAIVGGSRIFEYGVNTSYYFMMAWTKNSDLYIDCAEAFSGGNNNIYDGGLAPFTLGKQYHIAVTFERQGDGTTKVRATRRDAASGAIQRAAVFTVTNGIHTFSSPLLRLGRSFQGNADAKATYDEVRVWQGVLTDAQLKTSALAGPDANLSTLPWNASAVRYVAKATWQGGTPSSAADLTNSSNWFCTDQNGDSIAGVPGEKSVVIIPNGTTGFTIPAGYTPNWRKLQIGSEGKATAQWGKKTYTQASLAAQLEPAASAYDLQGDADVDDLARRIVLSATDGPDGLSGKQYRYDGWVYVTAAQAGRWAVSAFADDYAAFRLDDEWLVFHRVMDDGIRTAVADVAKGWHRFTIIVGDWYGGYGGCAVPTDHSCAVPVVVSIDGGNSVAFTSRNFTFGAPDSGAATAVTLSADADWSAVGEVSLDSGAELDLNGHSLTVNAVDSSFLGAKIKNSSATSASVLVSGGGVDRSNIALDGDITVAYASVEAFIGGAATFWLDASAADTITTNASGEVTRWASRVGSNAASTLVDSSFTYPAYDATTYAFPTVDFGAVDSKRDLGFTAITDIRTVFMVVKIAQAQNAFWLGGTSTYNFHRGVNGQYAESTYGHSKIDKIWNGLDEKAKTDVPTADDFIVVAFEMRENSTSDSLTADRPASVNSRNGGKQLSELIVFNYVLDDDDRIAVTRYLQRKWNDSRTVPIAHRWSFNGTTDAANLTDSVGGVVGRKQYKTSNTTTVDGGTVNWSNGKAVLSGGTGTGHLNLGQGVLGTGGAATLELWVTKDANASAWASFFSYNKPDTQNLLTLTSNHGSTASNNRNMIQNALNGAKFLSNGKTEVELTPYLPVGETYHYVMTFRANGNGTTIRWMIHDVETGALLGENTLTTTTSWTLADASDWSLTLGSNPWVNSRYDNPSSYDEVRVWEGALSDEQLRVNALMGPDASPDVAVTGSAGFALAANATFDVDNDYTTAGAVILGTGSKIRFNGPFTFSALGGISIPSGELADYIVADSSLYNVIIDGDVITVTCKAGSAAWTGAGRAGDVTDPNNWDCRDGFGNALPGELPSSGTAVTVSGTGINLQAPAGTTLQCGSFTVRGCTFAEDCDWRGLPVTPILTGTADLNGHNLRLNRLTASSGAALANGGSGVCGIVFNAAAGSYNESSYVDGIANLATSENARIVIERNGDDAVSSLNVGNTASVWTEVRITEGVNLTSSANPSVVGNVAGANGIFTIDGGDVTFNSFKVQVAGNGTVNLNSGSLTVTGWTDYGNTSSGTATFNQSGGTFETRGNFWFGRTSSGTATYNMTDGTFNVIGSFRLGSSGGSKGIFNQSGGTIEISSNNDFTFGYDSNTSGKYMQTGGLLKSNRNIDIGRNGTGLLDIGGTVTLTSSGGGLSLGSGSSSTGEVILRDGGVLNTSFMRKWSAGKTKATFAGGKIVAKDANNASTFIAGIGDVTYAAGGLTVDTAGYNVSMANNTVSNALPGSALVKQGAGTLTVDAFPPVDTVKLEGGTLALSSSADNSAAVPVLAHRWSFNGDLLDSVTGAQGTKSGSVVFTNGDTQVYLEGGSKGTSMVDLGANKLPAQNVTLEFWTTLRTARSWCKMFCLGSGTGNGLVFTYNKSNASGGTSLWINNKLDNVEGTGKMVLDTPYHVAIAIESDAASNTVVRASMRNSSTSVLVGSIEKSVSGWTVEDLEQTYFYLGRAFWNDADASCNFDEVRVWNGALSDAAIAFSATKGPDATAMDIAEIAAASGRTLEFTGGTLALNGNTLRQPIVKGGAGTLTTGAGSLAVTDSLVVNLADSIAGRCIRANGAIDFTGARLVIEDPELLETHRGAIYFIRATQGGSVSFTGSLEPASPLPAGWSISLTSTGAKLQKSGLALYLK